MSLDKAKHCQHLQRLIQLEFSCEQEEHLALLSRLTASQLQRHGYALLNLRVESRRTGLGGRCIYELVSRLGGKQASILPSTSIRVGDLVRVRGGSSEFSGVVYKITAYKVEVASVDEDKDVPDEGPLQIVQMENKVSFDRQVEAVGKLEAMDVEKNGLVKLCFEKQDLATVVMPEQKGNNTNVITIERFPITDTLNHPQREAVLRSTGPNARLSLIHGPPGTGKTATVVEIIKHLALQGHKILVCGPSNLSVDNIVERLELLHEACMHMVRLGHPARILESVQRYSLDAQVNVAQDGVLDDIREEILTLLREPRKRYKELKQSRRELHAREAKLVTDILRRSNVVLCTLNMAGSGKLMEFIGEHRHSQFDAVIIDEGSQSIEPESWIAALHATKKLIMAGDHKQLPPTLKSKEAKELERTLFERLLEMYPEATSMLTIQYRMHNLIMGWANESIYMGKLVADASVANALLKDLPGVQDNDVTSSPLYFYDTAGFDCYEILGGGEDGASSAHQLAPIHDSQSKSNRGEAGVVVSHLKLLLDSGVPADQIAVITPYNGQVDLLKELVTEDKVEIGTGKNHCIPTLPLSLSLSHQ